MASCVHRQTVGRGMQAQAQNPILVLSRCRAGGNCVCRYRDDASLLGGPLESVLLIRCKSGGLLYRRPCRRSPSRNRKRSCRWAAGCGGFEVRVATALAVPRLEEVDVLAASLTDGLEPGFSRPSGPPSEASAVTSRSCVARHAVVRCR